MNCLPHNADSQLVPTGWANRLQLQSPIVPFDSIDGVCDDTGAISHVLLGCH